MKAAILVILLTIAVVLSIPDSDAASNPSWSDSKYVENDRFDTTKMTGTVDNIVTDTKTGCQYMVIFQTSTTLLGCWDEYKKPDAK